MKEETIVIDNEIYISSSRAGKQFGYTSDYIGFLAREGKLKSRIIGRTRFVSQKSLADYKLFSKNNNHQPQKVITSPFQDFSKKEIILPASREADTNFSITRSLVLAVILISLILPPLISKLADYVFDFSPGNGEFIVASVGSASPFSDTIGKIKVESAKLDEELFDFLNSTSGQIATFFDFLGSKLAQLVREVRTILVGETEITEIVMTGSTTTPVVSLDEEGVKNIVYQVLEEEKISAGLTSQAPVGDRLGLGVFPSSGDQLTDERLIRSIEGSFSDEVIVRLDQSRRAGVITPVFRELSDDNYIFVLVPVTEKNDGI